MKKLLKIVSLAGVALVVFLGVVLFAFYYLVQVGEFRRFVINEVEKRTRMRVTVGKAELKMGSMVGISLQKLTVIEPKDNRPLIMAPRILIRVALLPLLEGKLIFHEIRLYRPSLQVVRNAEGKISLPDLTNILPFQKQAGPQFTVNLRKVIVQKGEVLILDHQNGRHSNVPRFHEIDLTLRRIRTKNLARAGSKIPLNVTAGEKERLALEISLRTTIERSGKRTRLASKGRLLFPNRNFEIRHVWFDLESRLVALPVGALWRYYGGPSPIKSIRGTLGARLRWQGSIDQHVHATGEIDFKGLNVEVPDSPSGAAIPAAGRLELTAEWTPGKVRFPRLDLRSKDISFKAQASLRSLGEKDPYLEIHVTTPFLPLLNLRKYVPVAFLASPKWGPLIRAVVQGEVRLTKAGVDGRLSEIRRASEIGFEKHIWLDAEVRGAAGILKRKSFLPLRDVSGRLLFEKGVLYYKDFKGTYGLSRLGELNGSYKRIFTGSGAVELEASGDLDLAELREQVRLTTFLPRVTKFAAGLKELGGKGEFQLRFRKEIGFPYHVEGKLSLNNVVLRTAGQSFSQISGDLSFSPEEISGENISARLENSPIHVRGRLSRYLSREGSFDVTVTSSGVHAGTALEFFSASGSRQDPGTVSGSIRYHGSLASSKDRSLSGSLKLIGVRLPLPFLTQPLRKLAGEVRIGRKGLDFRGVKGQLGPSSFKFNGRWRSSETPQLTFTFNSPDMNLGYVLSHIDPGASAWYKRLEAKGSLSFEKGRYEGLEFSKLGTDLKLDKRIWRLSNFSAQSSDGTVQGKASFNDRHEGISYDIEPEIKAVPVQKFLRWFDIKTRKITGKLDLAGKLESSGTTKAERKRNLSGSFKFKIKDGVAKRLRILVRILNLMDLTRWFSLQLPDLKQKGIRFRSLTADVKVKKGVYLTENLLVDSDDLGITGTGQIDGPNAAVDAVFALRPFPRVNSAVSYIPLIGPGIAGIKDSIMVASFHVKGPLKGPTITPAPLSTLSEFFFGALKIPQKIITLPGTGTK